MNNFTRSSRLIPLFCMGFFPCLASDEPVSVPCKPSEFSYRPYVCAKNYYVDAVSGNDSNSGSNLVLPWKTLQRANYGRVAGDCINVAPGNYFQAGDSYYGLTLTAGGKSNTPSGYVSWISSVPRTAKISGSSAHNSLVGVFNASYIIFDGFNIDASGLPGSGFIAGDANGADHHIMILNSQVHGAGAAGISMNFSEFYTIVGNDVYDNQFTNPDRSSGISIYEPAAATYLPTSADVQADHHITISCNSVHGNIYKDPAKYHSDGNGLILDDFLHTQDKTNNAYNGSTLLQRNVLYGNGGKGIQIFYSKNVDVFGNIAYGNNRDKLIFERQRGEINISCSTQVRIIDNMGYAEPTLHGYRRFNTAFASQQISGCSVDVVFQNNVAFPSLSRVDFPTDQDFQQFTRNNANGADNSILRTVRGLNGGCAHRQFLCRH